MGAVHWDLRREKGDSDDKANQSSFMLSPGKEYLDIACNLLLYEYVRKHNDSC